DLTRFAVVLPGGFPITQGTIDVRQLLVEGRKQWLTFAAVAFSQGLTESVPCVFKPTLALCIASLLMERFRCPVVHGERLARHFPKRILRSHSGGPSLTMNPWPTSSSKQSPVSTLSMISFGIKRRIGMG